MKKILFIDPLSPEGHVQYNKYWFEALDKLKCQYTVILKQGYKKNFNLEKKIIEIPEYLYEKVNGTNSFLKRRYYLLKILLYIKKNVNFDEYDTIVYSSYENFSFFMYMFLVKKKKKIFAILHNNLEKINNWIVYSIIKFISKKIKLISLDLEIKKLLIEKGIKTVLIPHPIPKKFKKERNKNYKKWKIFSPSKTSINEEFILSLSNEEKFFEENDIKIELRSSNINFDNKVIKISTKYLSSSEYIDKFIEADIILLPYKKSFQNRVSNIFFEAIANEKLILIDDNSFLGNYKKYKVNGIGYYRNLEEFKLGLLSLIKDETKDFELLKNNFSIEKMMKMIKINMLGEL